ncbi:MAG: radical SAM protein [Myxococcota bacterium]
MHSNQPRESDHGLERLVGLSENPSPALRIQPLRRLIKQTGELDRDRLLIHEIYASIQGESTHAGKPCVFVRTAVCHLRCRYCDTPQAFTGGTILSVREVMQRVQSFGISLVEITGGEPLLQPAVPRLMTRLCDRGMRVLLETSGAVGIDRVDRRVCIIVDVKTPGSSEVERNRWRNLDVLWPGCEVKFVICDAADYVFAKRVLEQHRLHERVPVLFSPEAGGMSGARLAEWIVRDRLPVRLQLQLHKVLWGDRPGV